MRNWASSDASSLCPSILFIKFLNPFKIRLARVWAYLALAIILFLSLNSIIKNLFKLRKIDLLTTSYLLDKSLLLLVLFETYLNDVWDFPSFNEDSEKVASWVSFHNGVLSKDIWTSLICLMSSELVWELPSIRPFWTSDVTSESFNFVENAFFACWLWNSPKLVKLLPLLNLGLETTGSVELNNASISE